MDDLKRVLSGGQFTTGLVGRFSSPPEDQDTMSDSLVDVEGEDLGSESGEFVTPPSRVEGYPEVPVPPIPEDLRIASKKQPAEEEPPLLQLHDDALVVGSFPTNGEHRPSSANLQPRPPAPRDGGSVKSKSLRGKKNLAALLAGIGSEEDTSIEESKFTGMVRPPY